MRVAAIGRRPGSRGHSPTDAAWPRPPAGSRRRPGAHGSRGDPPLEAQAGEWAMEPRVTPRVDCPPAVCEFLFLSCGDAASTTHGGPSREECVPLRYHPRVGRTETFPATELPDK